MDLAPKILEVNEKFCRMLRGDYDITKAHILAGVLLLDEYRLYPWFASGRPAKTFVDVGGHYGSFTVMAKTLWPECTVRAYEPHPVSQEQFRLNTAELSGVTLVPAAAMPMSHEGGPVPLYLSPGDNDGGHSVCANSERQTIQVDSVRLLDDLRSIGSPPIDVLKLDCEGMETALLADLSESGYLANVGFICGEWHGVNSIPRIEATLTATHVVEICRHNSHNSGFFAWKKP